MVLLKKVLTVFFSFAYKFLLIFLRFVFYKIVVKIYKLYLFVTKKLGWSGFNVNPLAFLVTKKLTHSIVGFMIIFLVIINLTEKSGAVSLDEIVGRTILADLVESEFGSLEDEELIEEFFEEGISTAPGNQNYLDSLSSVHTQPGVLMESQEEISKESEAGMITYGGTAIVKPEMVSTAKTKRTRRDVVYYTVEPGDTISTIAEEFEISVNTILWENDLNAYSLIQPGKKLSILPATGISHVVKSGESVASLAKKYNIEQEKIVETNGLGESGSLVVGQKVVIPGGAKSSYVSSRVAAYSGLNVIKDLVKSDDAIPVAGNKMNWPAEGHRITQYYSWRHKGLDIANKTGTALYAADAGTVEYAGWGTGYGNTVLINHGGGKKTRYAHLSKFYVEKGEKVSKGEAIGAMGSTGWSTGPHLHFEVIINGVKYNPLNYIK